MNSVHNATFHKHSGLIAGILSFVLWGLAPIYFKQIAEQSAWTILAHRIVWSFFFVALLLAIKAQWRLGPVFRSRKLLFYLFLSTSLIGFNWFIFTWAVINDQILETSLGYFINPLVNVLFGLLIFKENLRLPQKIALIFASLGVAYQIYKVGEIPLIALALAFSFAFYGLIRKMLPVDALNGLFVETLLMLPFALAFLLHANLIAAPISDVDFNYWLLLAGAVTSVPLALFAAAAQKLALTTIGFLQFIAPSLTFAIAVLIYDENLNFDKLITFAFIWFALLLFSSDSYRHLKKHALSRES